MIVNDDIRKCVVFIGIKEADEKYKTVGTAFYIGRDICNTTVGCPYLVTARHVIDGIKNLGLDEVYLRINLKSGGADWAVVPINAWRNHPKDDNVDVAIMYLNIPPEFDHLMIPLSMFLTSKLIADHKIGIGDEVFITGLFRHHHGKVKNIPIVRIGNLAAMDEEKIITKDFGAIAAYLIEVRSIGGLSGSPVFLNLGYARQINGLTQFAKGTMIFFLGLIHGHFDQSTQISDIHVEASEKINTGIAIVIPYYKILEVLDHPDFIARELELGEKIKAVKSEHEKQGQRDESV